MYVYEISCLIKAKLLYRDTIYATSGIDETTMPCKMGEIGLNATSHCVTGSMDPVIPAIQVSPTMKAHDQILLVSKPHTKPPGESDCNYYVIWKLPRAVNIEILNTKCLAYLHPKVTRGVLQPFYYSTKRRTLARSRVYRARRESHRVLLRIGEFCSMSVN